MLIHYGKATLCFLLSLFNIIQILLSILVITNIVMFNLFLLELFSSHCPWNWQKHLDVILHLPWTKHSSRIWEYSSEQTCFCGVYTLVGRDWKKIVSLLIKCYLDREPKKVRERAVLHIWKGNVLGRGNSEYKGPEMSSHLCVLGTADMKRTGERYLEARSGRVLLWMSWEANGSGQGIDMNWRFIWITSGCYIKDRL